MLDGRVDLIGVGIHGIGPARHRSRVLAPVGGRLDDDLEVLGHRQQSRLHLLQLTDEEVATSPEPREDAIGFVPRALHHLVAFLAILLRAALRVGADTVGLGLGFDHHAVGFGLGFVDDATGLAVRRGEQPCEPLGDAIVGVARGCGRGGDGGLRGLRLQLAAGFLQVLLERLDLDRDRFEIVADLVGVVAAAEGGELTTSDLLRAGKQRQIEVTGGHGTNLP